jgi:hypothetical protein
LTWPSFGFFAFGLELGFGFVLFAAATACPGGAALGRLRPRGTSFQRAAATGFDFAAPEFKAVGRLEAGIGAGVTPVAGVGRSRTPRSCSCCTPS